MNHIDFIQDMAIITVIVGFITVLFHRLKQPVVLGYILGGVIIGPYTPPFLLIQNQETIRIFGELGVIFLMFSLGLEFSLPKLQKVGVSALITSLIEIVGMIWIGYEIGHLFHWKTLDALFLGAMLSISSTTIIVKTLNELGLQKEHFAQSIFGILVIEDILAIGILAVLSGIGTTKSISFLNLVITFSKLLLFLVVSMSIGILIIPRIISYIYKFKSKETLLVSILGLCFGFCLLVIKLQYSIVLGAFLMGAIIAESRQIEVIDRLIAPLRDMFSAIFFVTIGLMLDPRMLIKYAVPILIITVVVIVGKILTCSFGSFITGNNGRSSLHIGMGLAQIGEFSFIIASLGLSLKLTSDFLYPIAVAVSVLTTMFTPYLIKWADPLEKFVKRKLPYPVVYIFQNYSRWLQSIVPPQKNHSSQTKFVRKYLFNIFLNLAFISTIFLGVSYFINANMKSISSIQNEQLLRGAIWFAALLFSLPFLLAIYHKVKLLSMKLAELTVKKNMAGRFTIHIRKMIARLIPILSMVGILFFIFALSTTILPSRELFFLILVMIAIICILLWKSFIKLYEHLHKNLLKSFNKPKSK